MKPEEWPIAASAADRHAPARRAGRQRLATVRTDFFLPADQRLSEQERALMTALLHCLVADVVREIQAALPVGAPAANDEDTGALVERLLRSGLLDIGELVALLLRRADEERIATAARARSGRTETRMLQALVSHDSAAVAAAAMALIIARGRRRDRLGQCQLLFDDVPPPVAGALVHAVAAALRGPLTGERASGDADAQLTTAAAAVLNRHDSSRSEAALTEALASWLAREDDCEARLLSAANDGEVSLVAGLLANRAALPAERGLDELLSGSGERVSALFRLAGVSRQIFGGFLAAVGDLFAIADPGEAMGCLDAFADSELAARRNALVAPAEYRAALEILGMDDGQRSV